MGATQQPSTGDRWVAAWECMLHAELSVSKHPCLQLPVSMQLSAWPEGDPMQAKTLSNMNRLVFAGSLT